MRRVRALPRRRIPLQVVAGRRACLPRSDSNWSLCSRGGEGLRCVSSPSPGAISTLDAALGAQVRQLRLSASLASSPPLTVVAQSPTRRPSPPRQQQEEQEEDEHDAAMLEDLIAAAPFAPQVMRVTTLYQLFTSPSPDPRHGDPRARKGTVSASAARTKSGAAAEDTTNARQSGVLARRKQLIRVKYRTFKNLLLHLSHENDSKFWGIYVSFDGMLVTRAADEDEAGEAFQRRYDMGKAQTQRDGRVSPHSLPDAGDAVVGRRGGGHQHLPDIPASAVVPSDFCAAIEGTRRAAGGGGGEGGGHAFRDVQRRRAAANAAATLRSGPLFDSLLETYMPGADDDAEGDAFTPPPPPSTALFPLSGMSSSSSLSASSPSSSSTPSASCSAARDAKVAMTSPSTFTPQMLVPLLPTYFIPIEALLAQLPEGYSAAHVSRIFGETGCIDLVTLPAASPQSCQTFVRLHGERSHVRFGVSPSTEARWRQKMSSPHGTVEAGEDMDDDTALSAHAAFAAAYAPDPFLCDAFAHALHTCPGGGPHRWQPLRAVLAPGRTPPHLLAALGPFGEAAGMLSLLYFAQMQHRFQFAADDGGYLCAAAATAAPALREETTPTPIAVAELVAILHDKQRVYVGDLEQVFDHSPAVTATAPTTTPDASLRLSDFSKTQIIAFYGTLRCFLACHPDIFHLADAGLASSFPSSTAEPRTEDARPSGFGSPLASNGAVDLADSPTLTVELTESRMKKGGGVVAHRTPSASPVCRPSARLGAAAAALPPTTWEEKLEKALLRKDRRAAQKARRRLAIAQNPDSPFADAEVLLDAVLRYLPTRHPVSLRYFVKSLPPRLADFMPEIPLQFFKSGAPHKVQVFEWRRRNQLYLLRPGLPLPDGRLREVYTEKELLYMVAEELSRHAHMRGGGPASSSSSGSGGSEALSSLFSRLPYGARMCLGNGNKPFFQFLQRHPAHFMLVFPDAVNMDVRAVKVTLLAPLAIAPEELGEELRSQACWHRTGENPTAAELEAWRVMDEAAMRERVAEVERESEKPLVSG